MEIDENIARLIADLEFQIGNECYNPNSYNGRTFEEGCNFRYPVNIEIKLKDGKIWQRKIQSRISDWYSTLSEEEIRSLTYKFGSNQLHVGLGIINVLNRLERRYGLDFNELEKARNNK